jgi:hypothetical protein
MKLQAIEDGPYYDGFAYELTPSYQEGIIVVETRPEPGQERFSGHLLVATEAFVKGPTKDEAKAGRQIDNDSEEAAVRTFFKEVKGMPDAFTLKPEVLLKVAQRGTGNVVTFAGEKLPEHVKVPGPLSAAMVDEARVHGAILREHVPAVMLRGLVPEPGQVID